MTHADALEIIRQIQILNTIVLVCGSVYLLRGLVK